MSNAYRIVLLSLLLTLPPTVASAQAADPVEDRQRAPLVGTYALVGASDADSQLVLKRDGHFEWRLSYGTTVQSASGQWNVGADKIVLTVQAPAQAKPLFSLDEVAPWNSGAQKRLDEFVQERDKALTEEACSYLRTYRVGLESSDLLAAANPADSGDPARRSVAERALAPALAALEQARLALETAAAAVRPIPWQRPPGAAEAAAAAAQAAATGVDPYGQDTADRAVRTYLQRLQQLKELHAAAGRDLPALRDPRLGRERCLDPAAQADPAGGYAVVVGDPERHSRAEGIGVEFVYSDGRSERSETSPGGWALAVRRPGARLQRAVLQAADRPAETVTLDESRGRIFAIRLDSAAAMPLLFEQLILSQDDGDLVSPQIRGRYVRK